VKKAALWVLCLSALSLPALGIPLLKVDEAKIEQEVMDEKKFPQFKKWIDIAKKTPTKYSGTVYLDGKPLAGARVTDGLTFVATDKNGRYEIEVKFDAMTPYLPARTISVSWPEGTWPVKDKTTGRLLWWKRLMDVRKTPGKADFFLKKREIEPQSPRWTVYTFAFRCGRSARQRRVAGTFRHTCCAQWPDQCLLLEISCRFFVANANEAS